MLPKFKPLILGDLPTYQLSQFGLHLEEGKVYMSIAAQKHAYSRHGEEFEQCAPFLSEVVETPSAVGQSPRHVDFGFELVKEFHSEKLNVLVAVKITQSNSGLYLATSAYPITSGTIENRVRRGFLIFV